MPAVMFLAFHKLIHVATSYYITVLQCNPRGCFRMFLIASYCLCNVPENHSKNMSRGREDLKFISLYQPKHRKTAHSRYMFTVKVSPQKSCGK